MENDDLKKLYEKRNYFQTWIKNLSLANDMLPRVQRDLEITEWEIDALSSRPTDAYGILPGAITVIFETEYNLLSQVLPMIPSISLDLYSSSDAVTISGSACVYTYVATIGDLGTQEAKEYSVIYTQKYRQIQEAHDRVGEIKRALNAASYQSSLERFVRAENSYLQYKAGIGEKTAAAMEVRTFLDGFLGNLKASAKRWEKENTPTWEKMAERLCKGDALGFEYQEILKHESTHRSLISRLSTVGKDREGNSADNFEDIWTLLLDHVYSILNLIKI